MQLNENDLVAYLADHPDFFERHAELLAAVQLQSPHGNRAVSLQERQAEMLRDKVRTLEHRLAELLRNAADNEALSDRVLDWAGALLRHGDPLSLPQSLLRGLQEAFDLPLVALRAWELQPEFAELEVAGAVSADIPVLANSLNQPYCGPNAGFEAAHWLDAPAQSLALVPLRMTPDASAFGLLVLGSPAADRFTAEMGTAFLARIGELASAALTPLVRAG